MDLNKKLGVTSVVVTHEMDPPFASPIAWFCWDRGKFIAEGTAEEMRKP